MRWIGFLAAFGLACAALDAGAQTPDRLAGWRSDIAVIRDQFLTVDRSFSDDERVSARARLDQLEADLPRLSDQQIVAQFAMVAASSHNAHTRAYLLRNRGWWRRYPIRVWPFADGWRVIAVQPGYEALLGIYLTRIGGRAIEDAQRAVRPLFAGNDAWARYMATYSLTSPDALLGVSFTASDTVRFEGRGARGAVAMDVHPAPFVRRDGPEESWWFLSPSHPAVAGWIHVLTPARLPTFLASPEQNYLFRRCTRDVLYVQFFRAQNGGTETLAQFGQRLLAEMQSHPPRKVVVDLRFNTGGDLNLARPFFEALAHTPLAQRPGGLFAISGINTFSAGITPLAQLRQDAPATIVGEGPGDDLDFWAEGGNVALPYSGILMHYADQMHTYSRTDYHLAPELLSLNLDVDRVTPDRGAAWRWRDYIDGRDASLRAISRGATCGAPVL